MRRPTKVSRRWVLFGAAGIVLLADAIARRRSVRRTAEAGMLIVQIDGLGLPALRRAIDGGHAPFIGGLLNHGEATVEPWFFDRSSGHRLRPVGGPTGLALVAGQFLRAILGYSSTPEVTTLAVHLAYLAIVLALYLRPICPAPRPTREATPAEAS